MYLENSHCISIGYFSKKFCDEIISLGEKNTKSFANLDSQNKNTNKRNSKISWIKDNNVITQILPALFEHNKKAKWNFNIVELEPLQYTVYDINDHYDWHIDNHSKPYANGYIRKISFTICLNDDYEGGEFEISLPNPKPEKHINTKLSDRFTQGTIITFPSFVWHKVNPVTKGTRKVLVGWYVGPSFV